MSEEIRKKIDFSVKSFKPESGQTAFKIGAEFGYQLAQEEFKPSQDELWDELEDECMGFDPISGAFLITLKAKERYRITRVK